MQNSILDEIKSINDGLKRLRTEEVMLGVAKAENEADIEQRRKAIEAEYTATLAAIAKSDKEIESTYQRDLANSADEEERAERTYLRESQRAISGIRSHYSEIEHRDRKYIKDLESKCLIAANNNQKILKKYGQIPRRCTTKPDMNALYALFDRIMTDTAESFVKRTFKRDGFYAQDAMVRDFIQGAAYAIAYLNYEIEEVIPNDRDKEIETAARAADLSKKSAASSAASSKDTALQAKRTRLDANEQKRRSAAIRRQSALDELKQRERQYKAESDSKNAELKKKADVFFGTRLITDFAERTAEALKDSGAFDADWDSYSINRSVGRSFVWGHIHAPILTDSQFLRDTLVQKIPLYCKKKYFAVPLLMKTESASKIFVQYTDSIKSTVYGNIQSFILQKLRSNSAKRLKVYFADPNDRGQNLGVLIATNDKNEQIGVFTRNTDEEISDLLKDVETHIDEANGIIGNHTSIYDYNAKNENKLDEFIIVLCDVQDCVSYNDLSRLKVIWEKAERYGINIILTSKVAITDIEKCYENKNTDMSFLRKESSNTMVIDGTSRIAMEGNSFEYTPSQIKDTHRSFVANYRDLVDNSLKLNNNFADVRSKMLVEYENDRQRKLGKSIDSVKLPVLINTETNKIDTDFEIGTSNDVHMLVTGGTGSGKSRFLFSVISSIAMNYHPDDVEMWLIDCKINEFKPFIDKYRLPHIKMVALERTEEFCKAFFKYLSEEIAERVRLFGEVGCKSIDKYREAKNDPHCMPRIIIIVDEFHALTQVLNDDRALKNEMENALAEYRSYGISFIFSDQSYEKITMSLQQVNCRLALRGDIENMRQTLRTKGDFSQQLISDFEHSEGKGDAWWGKKLPTRFKNVYISEGQELEFFEEMADKWNIEDYRPKHPIYIDGQKRYPYDERTAMCAIREVQAQLDEFDDYQMDLVLGQPTTFDSYTSICLKQGRRENLLMLGESEMSMDVIGAVIKSIQYNGVVRIIAIGDRTDSNFKKFRRYAAKEGLNQIEIYHDYEDICNIVSNLHKQVQNKKEFRIKTVVFWFALNSLCEELSDFSQVRKNQDKVQDTSRATKEVKMVSEEEKNQFMSIAAEVFDDEDDFDLSGLFQEIDEETVMTVSETFVDDGGSLYNASDDILELFANGSRFGLFNIAMIENPSDESRIKGVTKRWDSEQFKHKIYFCMSRANANAWNMTEASMLEENLTALYSNGIRKNVFKPYYTVNEED